ncbi:MAG TPA: PEP-CTERM sorting domain-containing protein [Pirellulales bacterium]|nr:PEP-CTERM sorting domain-containing protein [Pirellulales bacterium]
MTLTEFTTNDLSQITVLGVVAVIGDNLQVTELGGTGNDLLLVEALVAVPEPSTLILAGIGLLGLLACWRRNRRRA